MLKKRQVKIYLVLITGVALISPIVLCYAAMILLQNRPLILESSSKRNIVSSSLPIQPLWQVELDEAVNKQPVLGNNVVVVSTSKTIYGLDATTGQRRWEHKPNNQASITPRIAGDRVIYGNRRGEVTALDLVTGEVVWQHIVGGHRYTVNSIAIQDEYVYVATQPTEISAFDLQTGELIWNVKGADQDIPSRAARIFLWNDILYVVTTEIHTLDSKTGEIKRTFQENIRPSTLVNGKFYAGLWIRDADTLQLIQELKSPSYMFLWDSCDSFNTPFEFSQNEYYAAGHCGGIFALDINSNKIQWAYRTDVAAETPIAIFGESLYALFDDGEIHAINPQTGEGQGVLKTNLEIPGFVKNASFLSRGIVADDNILVVTFNDRSVWAFCHKPCLSQTGNITNQCTRIATARFYNGYVPAEKWVIVATFADPQSRNFKR